MYQSAQLQVMEHDNGRTNMYSGTPPDANTPPLAWLATVYFLPTLHLESPSPSDTMKIFSSSLAIAMAMRLALILMLSFYALSQDEDLGQLLWNIPGTVAGIDAAIIGKELEAGGFLLDMGGKALNTLVGTDESKKNDANNLFLEPAPDSTAESLPGVSASDSTVKPVADGSAPDNTVEPATGIDNTVEQTNGKNPNGLTTNPSSNPLGQPIQSEPDKPAQIELTVIGDPVPPITSVDHECDSKASLLTCSNVLVTSYESG